MTDPTPTPTAQVRPEAGSKLEQLHAEWADAKAAADAAAARLKQITDSIKSELTEAAPGAPRVQLVSPHGPALGLTYSESWRIDTPRLKREQPELYVAYAKKSGSWRLAALRNSTEDGDE